MPVGGWRALKLSLLALFAPIIAGAFQGYQHYINLGQALVTSPLSFYSSPFSHSTNPSKRAYCTCLYDEGYVPGAILLGYSLKKHGMLDPAVAQNMVLLYTPGSLSIDSLEILKEGGWDAREVAQIPHPPGRPPAGNFMDQYTKLTLFELEEFEQIFYLDADTLVHRPFPEIWAYPVALAAARDVRMGHGWLDSINAGTLLLKPNRRVLKHMLEIAPIFKYNTVFAEQGLLNAYWAQAITLLPYAYNGQLGIKRVFPKIWEAFWKDVKIIHYTGVKPWEWHAETDMPAERELWWNVWAEMEDDRKRHGAESLGALGRRLQ
ncbi:hypothetical protein FRB94_004877 [Tulasnella sp. JGI-2019a]|nr:hypothetical protein FRB93_005812 [Tulasnella sp. JGI-2019a]KAG9001224.1 hypothetical protein FRB94_004877 [Tulasnella sp. JGI-2019a]